MAIAEQRKHHHGQDGTADFPRSRSRDPVCGISVDPATARYRADHAGITYFFCSANCQAKFMADPIKYVTSREAAPSALAPKGTIYTCPMHPQIRRTTPGNCPICGTNRW